MKINIGVFLTLLLLVHRCRSLRLRGQWKSGDFFKFLAKFGFQQTDIRNKIATQGYIYGHVTTPENVSTPFSLVVVDKLYFIEYYGNRTVLPRTQACRAMYKLIERVAWDPVCYIERSQDLLRKIPCPAGGLCSEEDRPESVVKGYQFTYKIQDMKRPRFWYASMSSCYRNESQCKWYHDLDQDVTLNYDIWLVNGSPYTKHFNPFEHQFSFEMHDVFELYAVFLAAYCMLVPVQVWALCQLNHAITKIFTLCMCMEFVGALLNFVHVLKFAFDGEGVPPIRILGNVTDMLCQCLFMLLLMLIAKGWTITNAYLTNKWLLISAWSLYTLGNVFLFVWNLTEIDVISEIDEWQTWPGYLILCFRMCFMLWFLFELRKTFSLERHRDKQRFYLHFGAGFLVWFIYLPITALIGMAISALWRYKTLLSITYGADFLAFLVLCHLLWPSKSSRYFTLETKRFDGCVRSRVELERMELTALLSGDEEEVYTAGDSLITTTVLGPRNTSGSRGIAKPYHDDTPCDTDGSEENRVTRDITRENVKKQENVGGERRTELPPNTQESGFEGFQESQFVNGIVPS